MHIYGKISDIKRCFIMNAKSVIQDFTLLIFPFIKSLGILERIEDNNKISKGYNRKQQNNVKKGIRKKASVEININKGQEKHY